MMANASRPALVERYLGIMEELVRSRGSSMYGAFIKLLFDRVGGAVLALALAPVIAVLALAIRIRMGTPIIFTQTRIGLRDQPFQFYKFRTMTDARNADGQLVPDQHRMTAFGTFLRSRSLDELPQLWNVLHGEMSLVGPRPLLPQYLPRYNSFQRRRHEVKPGITGLAQVKGRNLLAWDEKFAMDVWYVDHRSAQLDLDILRQMVRSVVMRSCIQQKGHVTAAEPPVRCWVVLRQCPRWFPKALLMFWSA